MTRFIACLLQLRQLRLAAGELAFLGEYVELGSGAQLVAGAGQDEDLALVIDVFAGRGHFVLERGQVEYGIHDVAGDGEPRGGQLVAGDIHLCLLATRDQPVQPEDVGVIS